MYMSVLRSCNMGRRKHQKNQENLKISICCMHGTIMLQKLKEPPHLLQNLLVNNTDPRGPHFKRKIHAYNSLFAFTSVGGYIDRQINKNQVLVSSDSMAKTCIILDHYYQLKGNYPKHRRLYIHDTENEVETVSKTSNLDKRKMSRQKTW